MFRISHLDKMTNIEVLEMAKVKQTLLNTIQETREETTIFWTLDMTKGKIKTTDGRKDRRDKTQRETKKDLDN